MSRRFGRNQRRAERERIEALTGSLESARLGLLSHRIALRTLQDRNDDLTHVIQLWDAEIRSLLGPYTSFSVEDQTYRVDNPDQIRQMPVMPPTPMRPMPMALMPETLSYYVETMMSFIVGLDDEDLMTLRRLMTVRVQVGSDHSRGRAYFALSEQAWQQMRQDGPTSPGLNRFIHRIAGDLVRLLASPPKSKSALAPATVADAAAGPVLTDPPNPAAVRSPPLPRTER